MDSDAGKRTGAVETGSPVAAAAAAAAAASARSWATADVKASDLETAHAG